MGILKIQWHDAIAKPDCEFRPKAAHLAPHSCRPLRREECHALKVVIGPIPMLMSAMCETEGIGITLSFAGPCHSSDSSQCLVYLP